MIENIWILMRETRYEDVISVHRTLEGAEIAKRVESEKTPSALLYIIEYKIQE